MILLELFFVFVRIGFTSFGGLSMIPLINAEMTGHGWMTAAEVMAIVAIAEMTPGPVGLNCATFAGIRVAGMLGAMCATLGVLMPAFTTCLLVGLFFERFKKNTLMKNALVGIRPACVGLIAATAVTLSDGNYLINWKPYWPAMLIGGVVSFLIWKWNLSVPKVIMIADGMGLLIVR